MGCTAGVYFNLLFFLFPAREKYHFVYLMCRKFQQIRNTIKYK